MSCSTSILLSWPLKIQMLYQLLYGGFNFCIRQFEWIQLAPLYENEAIPATLFASIKNIASVGIGGRTRTSTIHKLGLDLGPYL